MLRFSNGYTRRANSVNPLFPSARALEENLAECEALYARRGQPVVFKITPAALPPGLDDLLVQHGYALEAHTSTQTLDLAAFPGPPAKPPSDALAGGTSDSPGGQPSAALPSVTAASPSGQPSAEIASAASDPRDDAASSAAGVLNNAEALPDEWLRAFWELGAVAERHQDTLRQMLLSLVPPACFASLALDGHVAACGLGVLHAGWLGLFDIITHPRHRGQGHAQRLIRHILVWGQARGARGAYLQVMLDNAPALALYERLGFREAYRYWYRVKA